MPSMEYGKDCYCMHGNAGQPKTEQQMPRKLIDRLDLETRAKVSTQADKFPRKRRSIPQWYFAKQWNRALFQMSLALGPPGMTFFLS